MRVFVTGANGYIGSAVAMAFRNAGHTVTGLVRSNEKAHELQHHEIVPVIGDLANTSSYMQAIKEAEVIVHCAFDPSAGPRSESKLTDAILSEAAGSTLSPRAFIYTSGVWVVGNTGNSIADESTPCNPIDLVKWRMALEERLMISATSTFRIAVIRPGCVFGGAGRLTSMWFDGTHSGSVEIVGDGTNHWAMIHLQDLAQAYVMAAEKEVNGVILNIVDGTTNTVREMAQAVASAAGIEGKIHSITPEEALKKYGPTAQGLLVDQQISNERARRLLGWIPRHKSFIQEIGLHYHAWKSVKH